MGNRLTQLIQFQVSYFHNPNYTEKSAVPFQASLLQLIFLGYVVTSY